MTSDQCVEHVDEVLPAGNLAFPHGTEWDVCLKLPNNLERVLCWGNLGEKQGHDDSSNWCPESVVAA